MDLQQLEYFRMVAKTENMTKAANELHIAQPSLSVAISRLETELGVKLFDRISGRVRLNQVGERFYRQTDRIFLAVQDAKQEVSDYSDNGSKIVEFAVTATNLCTEMLIAFMEEHQSFRVHQFLHTESNARSLLEEGKVDFVITVKPMLAPLVEWKPLKDERIWLLTSSRHPAAREYVIPVSRLSEYQYVLMKSFFAPEGEYMDFLHAINLHIDPQFITNEFETMVAMVEMNVGVTIVSEETAKKLLSNSKRRLSGIPIDTDYRGRSVGIARLKGHYLTKAAQELYDFASDYYSDPR